MNKIDNICRMIDAHEALDMLQEECAELIKAASKTKRVLRSDPSVDPRKTRLNLIEEIGDVENMLTIVMHKLLNAEEQWAVCSGESDKIQRYYERLIERQKKHA